MLMEDLDNQINYWDRVGPTKPFSHPVNLSRLAELIAPESHILTADEIRVETMNGHWAEAFQWFGRKGTQA